MEIPEREAMARAIVDGNSYMTRGMADADGLPWASPVWYAQASYREFFWVARLRLYRALASEQFVLSEQDGRLPFSLE